MNEFEANPPKDESAIRSALNKIRKKPTVTNQAGPYAAGLEDTHPVRVASFSDRDLAIKFQRRLSHEGMATDLKKDGRWEVHVDAVDAKRATGHYFRFKQEFQDEKQTRPNRYDFLIFGTIIGLAIGTLVAFGYWDVPVTQKDPDTAGFSFEVEKKIRLGQFFLLTTLIMATLGHLTDRVRQRSANRQSLFAIGMRDFILGVILFSLFFFSWETLARLSSLLLQPDIF